MKHARLLALVAAFALAASPLTWARSSGFSSSHSSSSHSSVSSTPSYSSGFGSRSSDSGSVGGNTTRTATTGLGSALYTAHASKAAADTYSSNKAPAVSDTPSRNTNYAAAGTGSTDGYANGSNARYGYHSTLGYPPGPVVVNHYHTYDSSSGSSNFLWGYLLGRSGEHHDTVVVQQPQAAYQQPQYGQSPAQFEPQPAGVVTPSGVQSQSVGGQLAGANAMQPALDVPAKTHGHPVLAFLGWLLVLGAVGTGGYFGLKAWSARKASYTRSNHYKL